MHLDVNVGLNVYRFYTLNIYKIYTDVILLIFNKFTWLHLLDVNI